MSKYDFSSVDGMLKSNEEFYGQGGADRSTPKQESDRWEFTKGLLAGTDTSQAMLGGAAAWLGEAFGSERVKNWGMDIYRSNLEEAAAYNPSTRDFTDIEDAGSALDWGMYNIGQMIPMVGVSLLGGGAGGVIGKKFVERGVKKFVEEEVERGVARDVAEEVAKAKLAKATKIGAGFGAFEAGSQLSTGEMYGEMVESGLDGNRVGIAGVHGRIAGALEMIPAMGILKRLGFGEVAEEQVKQGVLRSIRDQALSEGVTESAQTLIEKHAMNWLENNKSLFTPDQWDKLQDPELWKDVLNAGTAGAVGGGAMGGLSSLADRRPTAEKMKDKKDVAKAAGGDALDQANAASEVLAEDAGGLNENVDRDDYGNPIPKGGRDAAGNPITEDSWNNASLDVVSEAANKRAERLRNIQEQLYPETNNRQIAADLTPQQAGLLRQTRQDNVRAQVDQANGVSEPSYQGEGDFLNSAEAREQKQQAVQDRVAPVGNRGLLTPSGLSREERQRQVRDNLDAGGTGVEQNIPTLTKQQKLLPAPDSIKLGGPVADEVRGNSNTGMDGAYLYGDFDSPRMDSDPVERRAEMQRRSDEEMRKWTKRQREKRIPEGLDQRWLREGKADYKPYLRGMVTELRKGGGITYLRDSNDVIVGRTKSENPQWAQDLMRDTGASVKEVKAAVEKALNGEPLGKKQARIVTAMMDYVDSERLSPESIEFAKAERARKNAERRVLKEIQANLQAEQESFDATQDRVPDEAYFGEVEPSAVDESLNLTDAERVAVDAYLTALDAGVPRDIIDELELDADSAEAFASAIHARIRSGVDGDGTRRQGNQYEESEISAANEDNQTGSTTPEQAQGAGQSGLSTSQVEGLGQADSGQRGLLESYSEEDIAERERLAAEAKRKEKQDEAKAKIDEQVGTFSLTGSDRQADANPNQGDIFDRPNNDEKVGGGNQSSKIPAPDWWERRTGSERSFVLSGAGIKGNASTKWESLTAEQQSALDGQWGSGNKSGTPSDQFVSYDNYISESDASGLGAGLIQQIEVDERLNDGESEKLVAKIQAKVKANPATNETDSTTDDTSKEPELSFSDISEKAFVVKGQTLKHKNTLKSLGGKWNGKHKGWMFPKSKEDSIREQLGDLVGDSTKSKTEESKPEPKGDTFLGKGRYGDVYKDSNGVRYYVDSGVRVYQKVEVVPAQGSYPVNETVAELYMNERDFLTQDERKAFRDGDSPSDPIQDFVDGKRDDVPTVEEVEQANSVDSEIDRVAAELAAKIKGQNSDNKVTDNKVTDNKEPLTGDALYAETSEEKVQAKPSKLDAVADKIDSEIDDVAKELAALIKKQGSQMNSGVDPQILALGAKLGALYVSKGVVKFAQYAKMIIEKLKEYGVEPEQIKPSLKEFYAATQMQVSDEVFEQMDDQRTVRNFDLDSLDAESTENAGNLADFLYGKLDELTDNRKLRNALSDYFNVPASEVTNEQMKEAQEALELALVRKARSIVADSKSDKAAFDALVAMYQKQPNLNVRSSTSMQNQAYSTPAPLAYVASRMAGIDSTKSVYEPTAGNGMLVLGATPDYTATNELNGQRVEHLRKLGFKPTQKDATKFVPSQKGFDSVIMNPPFGKLRDSDGSLAPVEYDGYKLVAIDHLIAAKALEAMKDDGRATIIIGADKESGNINSNDRVFFNWLESNYNVTDHFEVDGPLYNRQGAGWPVRVIAINGRQKSNKLSPASGTIERLENWNDIYERFSENLDSEGRFNGRGTGSLSSDAPRLSGLDDASIQSLVFNQAKDTDSGRNTAGSRTATESDTRVSGRDGVRQSGQNAASNSEQRNDGRAIQQNEAETEARDSSTGESGKSTNTGGLGKPATSKPVEGSDYQKPYVSRSKGFNEAVLMPANLVDAAQEALDDLESRVGDIDQYVAKELGYSSEKELHKGLMGLQVDAVAQSIYNIKENKGVIIADQTGVGKGRQAAALIRYALRNGKLPVFVTVQPNLFTDMYNDLADIGSHDVRPFIFNASNPKSGGFIVGKNGKKLFANKSTGRKQTFKDIIGSKELPDDRNAVFLTYSQLGTDNEQREALRKLSDNALFIFDESHNGAGARKSIKKIDGKNQEVLTGAGFLHSLIHDSPVVYLSATFAKRPDNMPFYYRTDLMKAVDTIDQLIDAVSQGGIPLQQNIAATLVRAGQMSRRERSFEGISIPIVYDNENLTEHQRLSDNVTSGLRAVQNADWHFHNVFMEEYAQQIQSELGIDATGAGNKAGTTIDHANFNSVLHNYVRQLLLGLKAERAAEQAIAAFKQGKKPVIALENTMGAFLKEFSEDMGLANGDAIEADYRDVLMRALDRTRRVSLKDKNGDDKKVIEVPLSALDEKTYAAYMDAKEAINALDVEGVPISPIDMMRYKLQEAGLKVAELTGRNLILDYSNGEPVISKRPADESDKRGVVDRFNTGKLDALILNKSGSTGLSIHASEKAEFTDKRPRHMIVAQTMQDVNILVQMLGRINRTGQVALPTYELLGVALPAEKRQLAVGSRKLKSLNANTSANDESDTSYKSPDMLNKYGDQIAAEYLSEHTEIASLMDLDATAQSGESYPDLMLKMTGRMAMLDVEMQREIYEEMEPAYEALIDYLNRTGQNDLVAATLDTDARILGSEIVYEGKSPDSLFGGNTTLHRVDMKYQGKPPTAKDVEEALEDALDGRSMDEVRREFVEKKRAEYEEYRQVFNERIERAQRELSDYRKKPNTKPEKVRRLEQNLELATIRKNEYNSKAGTTLNRLDSIGIGSRMILDIEDEVVNAVVVGVKDSHKGKGDPVADSKLRYSFMVSSGVRTIDVPISKLQSKDLGDTKGKGIVDEHLPTSTSISVLFDRSAQADAREERFIATGNLIAGSAKLRGRIVNFTDSNGKTHQGILMPRKYGKSENDNVVTDNFAVRDPAITAKFLKNNRDEISGAGGIFSADQKIRLTSNAQGWVLQIPKANKDPIVKAVKFNKELQDAMGTEFFGAGSSMQANIKDTKLKGTLEALAELVPLYALPSMRDAWVKAGGSKKQEASQSFDDTRFSLNASRDAASTDDFTISRKDGQAVVDKIAFDWASKGSNVFLVDSFNDLPVEVQQEAKSQDAENDVMGVYHNDELYIVLDQHKTVKELEETIFHEAYGHYGLRKLLGKDISTKITRLYMQIGGRKGLEKYGKKHGFRLKTQDKYRNGLAASGASDDQINAIMTDELLAHMAQHHGKPSVKRTIMELLGAVRNWLREKGFLLLSKVNDADLFYLLSKSREAVKKSGPTGTKGKPVLMARSDRAAKIVADLKRNNSPLFSLRTPATDAHLDKLGLDPKEREGLFERLYQFLKEWWENKFNGEWPVYQRFYEGMFDGLSGLKRAEKEVGVTNHADSGYVGARLATGVADVMSAVLHYGAPEWREGILQHKEGTEGLLEILSDLGSDLDSFLAWMAAHRAEELMEQGRENNLTEDDIRALKAKAAGKEELFQDVKARYNTLNDAMLDMAEESGLIDPAARAEWQSEWYVPFYRQSDADGNAATLVGPRTKRGLSHQSAGIRALKGSKLKTNDLLENILQNWIKLTDSSMKNMAMLKAVDNLKDSRFLSNESMRFERAAIPKSEVNKRIKGDRVYREQVADFLGLGREAQENEVIDELAKLDNDSYELMWAIAAPKDPDVVRVTRNGKNEYYRVHDESLLRAVQHMDNQGFNDALSKTGRYFKRLLTTGVTASPDFIVRNFIRDAVHAWAINPDGFKFGKDSFKGMKDAWNEDADYRALMFAGASFQGGYVHGTDPDKSAEIVRRALEAKGLTQAQIERYESSLLNTKEKMKSAISTGWQKYRGVGDKIENANRLATFKAALASGKSMAQAAYESKDLMDYSLRGNYAALIRFTDVIPFLNARMQGLSKLVRAGKEDPKVLGAAGVKIAMFSVALALLNDEDERYQALPDWDKDANWHFFIGEDHWRIPKPFEIGILFGTMPERITHTLTGSQDNEKLMWSIKHNILHTMNVNPIPQMALPVIEVAANRSFFFDTPIEGMSDQGKIASARYNERTSTTMIEAAELTKAAEWLDLSPKQLEHLWNGYLGTLGSYALLAGDLFTNMVTGRVKPEKGIEDMPVVKSFYRGASAAKSTQYTTEIYDRINEVEEVYRTIRAYRDEGRVEDARALQQDNRDKLKYRGALGRARKQLGDINKQMERISRSQTLTKEVKRLRIERLRKRKNEVAERIAKLTDDGF